MATQELWLTIANVRLGTEVEVRVEGEAGDAKDGTWLQCPRSDTAPDKLYELVVKALQDNRKVSCRLISKDNSKELEIDQVRVQYQ